jgi:hypothetical protein
MDATKKATTGRDSRREKHHGGRPPKYKEPRRPVTVTLPERILRDLAFVNPDRSRAIVKCVESAMGKNGRPAKPVELIELTPGKALIVVGSCPVLKQIDWLRLIEIAPFRHLLVMPTGTAVEVLEVAINDLIQNLNSASPELRLLMELRDVIGSQRRGRTLSTAELLFVDMPKQRVSGRPGRAKG